LTTDLERLSLQMNQGFLNFPVVDLFAGPCELGESFATLKNQDGSRAQFNRN